MSVSGKVMRTSASSGWVNRGRAINVERRRPVVRFARADFTNFEAVPDGFVRFSSLLQDPDAAPDPSLLTRARFELSERSDVTGLAALRLAKGLSQKQLSEMIGTSQPRLSTWEKGSEKPGFESLKSLRNALAISADELLDALDG